MKPNLRAVDNTHPHARDLAREAIVQHRRAKAIDPDYDFSKEPQSVRQTIYNMTVKYGARSIHCGRD